MSDGFKNPNEVLSNRKEGPDNAKEKTGTTPVILSLPKKLKTVMQGEEKIEVGEEVKRQSKQGKITSKKLARLSLMASNVPLWQNSG